MDEQWKLTCRVVSHHNLGADPDQITTETTGYRKLLEQGQKKIIGHALPCSVLKEGEMLKADFQFLSLNYAVLRSQAFLFG